MYKIRVTPSENTVLYSANGFSISKGEIKEVTPSLSIMEAIKKGILIKVEN